MDKAELLAKAYSAISNAKREVDICWKRGQAMPSQVGPMLDQLRLATASVQELDNQLRGFTPPRIGP